MAKYIRKFKSRKEPSPHNIATRKSKFILIKLKNVMKILDKTMQFEYPCQNF